MALRTTTRFLRQQFSGACYFSTKSQAVPAINTISKMRFVQFKRANDEVQRLGVLSQDGAYVSELAGEPADIISFIKQYNTPQELSNKVANLKSEKITEDFELLPPISNPSKILCIGLNYKCHCDEQNKPTPEEPIFFNKFATTLVGAQGKVIAHKISEKIDWEVELAVVIGKEARFVSREKAEDYIFGYAVAQDITARDWQRRNGGQFLLGKSMDTFCPMGPAIVHKSQIENVNNLRMQTRINGVLKQDGNSKDMIFKIDDVISRLSNFMTLLPGDIILTGTPKGVGVHRTPAEFLVAGDVVETEIEGLGKMLNKVVAP